MNLDKLLQDIDTFRKEAIYSYYLAKYAAETWTMPDDPEEDEDVSPISGDAGLYSEMINLARNTSDEALSSEVLLIADMYKKALEINGGFNYINKAISKLITIQLDNEEDPEQEAIEDLLNKVSQDLRERFKATGGAATGDSPVAERELVQVKQQFNQQALQEDLESVQQEGVGDISVFDEKAKSTFDPTGGVSKEDAQTKGRGHTTTTIKANKDWVKVFENEMGRYVEEIKNENRPVILKRKQRLIEVLSKLINNTIESEPLIKTVDEDRSMMGQLVDSDSLKALRQLQAERSELQFERNKIKSNLHDHALEQERDFIADKIKSAKTDMEKFVLTQALELNKLRVKKHDKNRGTALKLRSQLIRSMSGGNVLSEDTLKSLIQKINEATQKIVPATVVRKNEAETFRELKKSGTLAGLIIVLRQAIATAKSESIKPVIAAAIKKRIAAEEASFKEYLDQLNEEKAAGLPSKNTAKELASKMKSYAKDKGWLTPMIEAAESDPQISEFINKSKMYYDYRNKLNEYDNYVKSAGADISSVEGYIESFIKMGQFLLNQTSSDKNFVKVNTAVISIINLLKQQLNSFKADAESESVKETE